MKILVLTGSPHKNGTTNNLTEAFIKGATENGHEVTRIDTAFKDIHPCIACERCHETEKGCVFKDDMEEVNEHLLSADAVVFVSPVYYYDITAFLKSCIDRFYANDAKLHNGKKSALIMAMADDGMESAVGAIASYHGMTNFLGWQSQGIVSALDAAVPEDLDERYVKEAYELGKKF